MTFVEESATRAGAGPSWVRGAGLACLVAGVLGAVSGVALAAWPTDVSTDRYSYPFTSDEFVAVQVWFAVQHLGLLAGLVALPAAGVMAPGRAARWGAGLAVGGMALLTVTELLAVTARDSSYPGEGTGLLDTLYGLSCTAAGIGLVVAGLSVRRRGAWSGWRRLVVLALGVWVFVPMMPAIMGPFLLARLAIAGWMLLFAALGYALWTARPGEVEPASGGPGRPAA
jgi:hypothetical protein